MHQLVIRVGLVCNLVLGRGGPPFYLMEGTTRIRTDESEVPGPTIPDWRVSPEVLFQPLSIDASTASS